MQLTLNNFNGFGEECVTAIEALKILKEKNLIKKPNLLKNISIINLIF